MASLTEFDDLLAISLMPFVDLSNQIGGLVKDQAQLVAESFRVQRKFIELASKSAKPASDSDLLVLLKPTSDLISQIQDIRDRNRKHEQFNQLSAVAEGIAALGWVTVAPTPAPYVKEMNDSAQFYTNKVLVAFKDKPDQAHQINWAKSWVHFLSELQQYVRKHHTTGLVWASQGTAPPPPPPPMAPVNLAASTPDKAMNDARAALFASINKGEDITKGLRKVTADQMTHKNPSLKQSSTVPDKEMQKMSLGAPTGSKAKGSERLELEGKKWMVENFTGRKDLVVNDTQMTQSVCVYRCNDCVLTVKGKINSIVVDSCSKFGIVFDSIVSAVEFINSQRIQAQAMEVVPTITVDSVDCIDLFLSATALPNVQVISSKSSTINISVPDAKGDYVEHPIPEQLMSIWNGKSFQTMAVAKN